MHKVAHQVIVFYDWISGPAMTQRERQAHKLAEASPLAGTQLVV